MTLQIFEAIAGLRINISKISVVNIGAESRIKDLADMLGLQVDSRPLKYLIMHEGAKCNSAEIQNEIIEKLRKKLTPWRRK